MHPAYLSVLLAGVCFLSYQLYKLARSRPPHGKVMRISEIYVYPIKSLRPTTLTSAVATKHGFEHDRTFMLLKATPEGHKNMAVAHYPEMTQFLTSIDFGGKGSGTITVTFRAFGDAKKVRTLQIPLVPDTEKLESFPVNMHGSPTTALKMPSEFSDWFSSCFGYEVLLVYLGDNRREVLFQDLVPRRPASLAAIIANTLPILKRVEGHRITFADCAPFLIVSKTSLLDVSLRLPRGEEMDLTKFRPNIVVEGAEEPWEEDYWCKLKTGGSELVLGHNCVRCKSINIDFETGKPGASESGQVLKKLQKDRRVDLGAKWSPVFGRYSFWSAKNPETQVLRVGDEVRVLALNKERTVWSWPGLA